MTKHIKTEAELKAATATGRALVDFWATWCGPCQMMGQVIADEIEPHMADLTIVKVNVDEAPELAAAWGIQSIPSLFCFKNGIRTASFVGVTSASEIQHALQ